jgi:hypothetical protein
MPWLLVNCCYHIEKGKMDVLIHRKNWMKTGSFKKEKREEKEREESSLVTLFLIQ